MLDTVYVIPEDVVLAPIRDLPELSVRHLTCAPNDYALTRLHARAGTQILSEEAGELFAQFRTPKTLVNAVLDYSREHSVDAEEVLDHAGLLLVQMVNADLLAPLDSETARATRPSLQEGDLVGEFEILHNVQMLQDTEVYAAKTPQGTMTALKIIRPDQVTPFLIQAFRREARILRHLDGVVSPGLLAESSFEGRPFLAIEWVLGTPLGDWIVPFQTDEYAAERNARGFDLACRIVSAYAHLHDQSVVHSDVHPNNVLVAVDGTVKLIDFGFARIVAEGEEIPPRGGVDNYFEPEYAAACLLGTPSPPSSFQGEQYAVATMVYELFSNEHYAKGKYLPFALEPEKALRQIVEEPPLSLTNYMQRFPKAFEEVLLTALAKEPGQRHPSLRDFAERLEDAKADALLELTPPLSARGGPDFNILLAAPHELMTRFMEWASPEQTWFTQVFENAPACSVNYGGAGIAFTLYRLACVRSDPQLLALADLWCQRTLASLSVPGAFFSRTIDITAESVGRVSPYHSETGAHLVRFLIGGAMGDLSAQYEAVQAFLKGAETPCDNLDLTLGLSGLLVAGAILMESLRDIPALDSRRLRDFGNAALRQIWEALDAQGPIADGKLTNYLGMAHGWAGFLYAALRWCQAAAAPIPPTLAGRLQELIETVEECDGGVRCLQMVGKSAHTSGWCHGQAGWIHLWTEAYRAYADPAYLTLAEKVGATAWYEPAYNVTSLCCGSAGRAYALLNLYNRTGEKVWLRRAHRMADHAIANADTGYSLYKGLTGVVALAADLSQPELASMPLFEREFPAG